MTGGRVGQPPRMDGWQVVADEHGLLRARDAAAAGLSRRDVAGLARAGQLLRVCRGWYCLAVAAAPPTEGESPAERHRRRHALLARAMIREFSDRAVASHHSALVLDGLPTFGADLDRVHVTRTHDRFSRQRPGLTVHEQVAGSTADEGVIEIPVAVVQTGVVNGPMASLIAADAALHRGLASVGGLSRALALVAGPGVGRVRRILPFADGRSESPGETRTRHLLTMMGLPSTPQVIIEDAGFHARVDLLLQDAPVVVEFDGFVKYAMLLGPGQRTPGEVVYAEKVREDRLRSLGYEVVRVTWSDLSQPALLRRRMDSAISRARGRRAA